MDAALGLRPQVCNGINYIWMTDIMELELKGTKCEVEGERRASISVPLDNV